MFCRCLASFFSDSSLLKITNFSLLVFAGLTNYCFCDTKTQFFRFFSNGLVLNKKSSVWASYPYYYYNTNFFWVQPWFSGRPRVFFGELQRMKIKMRICPSSGSFDRSRSNYCFFHSFRNWKESDNLSANLLSCLTLVDFRKLD